VKALHLRMAAELLTMAGNEFSNHGSNDMDWDPIVELGVSDKADLEGCFNAWNGSSDDPVGFDQIGDDAWMSFFAHQLSSEAEFKDNE
jgi:hypothetical protein